MTVTQKDTAVGDLLKQEAELARAKQEKIAALLEEQIQLARGTEARLKSIQGELKSLGWKHPRAPRAPKTGNGTGS